MDESHQKVYFVSSEASPLERQLYSIKLNGKDRTRISQGAGTHSISMSPTAAYYMDTFSSLSQPPARTLHSVDGAEWAVFRAADHRLTDEYEVLPTRNRSLQSLGRNAALRAAHQACQFPRRAKSIRPS